MHEDMGRRIALAALWCACAIVTAVEATTYTVGMLEQAPMIMRDSGDNDNPKGLIPDILAEVSGIMNAEFIYRWVDEPDSGNDESHPDWQGIGLRQVINGTLDIGASALTITPSRLRVVDYSRPITSVGIGAVIQKPRYMWASEMDLAFIFRPFPPEMWMYFIATYLVFGFCMFLLQMLHPREHRQAAISGSASHQEADAFSTSGIFWLFSTTCILQGFDRTPRSRAGRMLVVIWGIFVVFTIIFYAVSLSSHLETNTPRAYKSIETILDKPGIRKGYVSGGTTEKFLNYSRYRKIVTSGNSVPSIDKGMKTVRNGNFLFFIETPFFDYELARDCRLTQVGNLLNSQGFGFAFQKGSPLRTTFNNALRELSESGRLDALHQFWYSPGECSRRPPGENVPRMTISSKDYLSVIYVMIMGVVLTALVAALEVFYMSTWQKNIVKRQQLEGEGNDDVLKEMEEVTTSGHVLSPDGDVELNFHIKDGLQKE